MISLHVTSKLTAYLHKELSEHAARRVEMHLQKCESCLAHFNELEHAEKAALQRPLFAPDEDLWTRIEAGIMAHNRRASTTPSTRRVGVSWAPGFSLASAMVLLIVAGWWWTRPDLQVQEDIWPQWRGKNQDGKAQQKDVVKFDGGIELKIAWKKSLGSGYSSVSVADGRAVTMFSDSTDDYVAAFDAKSGDELWRFKIGPTYKGHDGSHDGPMSTPLLSGGTVYAVGPRGQLLALDIKTGKERWSTRLVQEHRAPEPFYGFATSPIIDDDVLIVETGGQGGTISGFRKDTGALVWSTGDDSVKYHSPIRFQFAGQTQLVCAGNNYLYGLEPRKGKVLWRYRHDGHGESINPVVVNQKQIFLRQSWEKTLLVELKREDRQYFAEKVWDKSALKSSYDTPISHAGYLYGFSSRLLKCVDAGTGETVWKSTSPGDGFTMMVGGFLIIVTKQGTLHVVEAHPEGYNELASLELFDGPAWSPPSFANGRIYARSLTQIACVEIVDGDRAGADVDIWDSEALRFAIAY